MVLVVKPTSMKQHKWKNLNLEEKSSTNCKLLAFKSLTMMTLRNIYFIKDHVLPSITYSFIKKILKNLIHL